MFSYLSKHCCCILRYITDSVRLIPLCILLLPHWLCPYKSFLENTTLGVPHYETARPRLRRRPRPHRSSRLDPDLLRLHPEQGCGRAQQHAPNPELRSGRSERLRYGSGPLGSNLRNCLHLTVVSLPGIG